MEAFGVHSEVGKLRKVMVHRPELSLQRLTPTNHDDLLFDDVLWVERAQFEHDRFVEKMRERGVDVYLLRDLLAEAIAASDEGRRRLIELVASEYTVGVSLVDEVRSVLEGLKPDELAKHLIGGLTVAEADLDLAQVPGGHPCRPPRWTIRARSSSLRSPTRCSRGTRRAGSTGGSRSTRCSGPRGAWRPSTSQPSTAITRCSRRRRSSTGIRSSATTDGSISRTSAVRRSRAETCSPSATARS